MRDMAPIRCRAIFPHEKKDEVPRPTAEQRTMGFERVFVMVFWPDIMD
jgi:hypothetical protein